MGDLCAGGFNGWGCWNFTFDGERGRAEGAPREGGGGAKAKARPGMPSVDCSAHDAAPNDLLAGMMQRVVSAVVA